MISVDYMNLISGIVRPSETDISFNLNVSATALRTLVEAEETATALDRVFAGFAFL
jgi:hypothetical protein